MRAFSYVTSLPVTWQRWQSHHSISHSLKKTHAACQLTALYVLQTELFCRSNFYIAGIVIFLPLLLLWPWPWSDPIIFIYELDLYSLEMYRMSENELVMSKLSKVIVWQTDRQTPPKLYTTPLRGWSITGIDDLKDVLQTVNMLFYLQT